MDETNDQETPVEEPAKAASCGRGHFFGGVLSGMIVGGALALLLAPPRGEQETQTGGSPSRSRKGIEEEGRLRAKVAMERVQLLAGSAVAGIVGAWSAVRERLSDAVEEGKEGIAEGQAEARARYEMKTKRRRRR
jgi:gas vesicle protein